MSRVLSYQSLFFIPLALGVQTSSVKWHETGGAQQPPPAKTTIARVAAASGKSQFASFNLAPMGWEVQPVQPPHPRGERSGSVQVGENGTEAPLVVAAAITPRGWEVRPTDPVRPRINYGAIGGRSVFAAFNSPPVTGWEAQTWAPPHPLPEKRYAAIVRGDDGTQASFLRFFPIGWEIQPWQPSHRATERANGSIARSDDGTQARLIGFLPAGWNAQPWQPPRLRVERSGAVQSASETLPPSTTISSGWQGQTWQPQRTWSRLSATKGRASFAFFAPFVPLGFEQTPQILRRNVNPAGIITQSLDTRIANPAVALASGWDTPTSFVWQPRTKYGGLGGRSTFAAFNNPPIAGWGATSVEMRRHVLAISAVTTEALAIQQAAPAAVAWGYEAPQHLAPRRLRVDAGSDGQFRSFAFTPFWQDQVQAFRARRNTVPATQEPAFTSAVFVPLGWDVQAWQPPHLRIEKAGSVQVGEGGIEAAFQFVSAVATSGWEAGVTFAKARRTVDAQADFSIAAPFIAPVTWGYDAPQFVGRKRLIVLAGPDSQFTASSLDPFGWPIQSLQPPRPRLIAQVTDGAIPFSSAALLTASYAWGYDEPFVYPRKVYAVSAAIAPHDDGTQATFIIWRNAGWEIQTVQPPHPRPEKSGSVQLGENGIEATFIFVPPPPDLEIHALPFLVTVGRLSAR